MENFENFETRKLDKMPFDKAFYVSEDREELCHATGDEIFIDGEWWNVYKDSTGVEYYGR